MAANQTAHVLPSLGIDVAKAKLDVALYAGAKFKRKAVANTPAGFAVLTRWLQRQQVQRVRVCLEATGGYSEAVATFLHAAGHLVHVVNPARVKAYGQSLLVRTKNDQVDARLLAQFAYKHAAELPLWQPPDPAVSELRALVRRVESLRQMRQQELNRLASLASLASGVSAPAVEASLQGVIATLDAEIARLEQLIRDHLDQHPQLKHQQELLDSIPGIGPRTAIQLLAEIVDWRWYASARALAAQAGLTPRQRVSGSSVRGRPRLSKVGAERLRHILYFPAVVALHHNPVIAPWAQRLLARHKHKMTVIAAVMRKLLHIVYGVLKSDTPFDPRRAQRAPARA